MKIKFTLLSLFFLSSVAFLFSRDGDISIGKGGLGGGLDISQRSAYLSNPAIEVHILDSRTGLEVDSILPEELDTVTKNLPIGEYLLIYSYANGSVIQEIHFLKE